MGEYATTRQGRLDALYSRIEKECGSVAREWGNSEEIDALQTSLYAEINSVKAEIEADFLAAWPLELTKARRGEWNNFANTVLIPLSKAGESNKIYKAQVDKEKELGFKLSDLKRAVKAHNI